MAVGSVQKFLNQLSKNSNVKSVVNEFNKLSSELVKRGHELNNRLTVGKNETVSKAQMQYKKVAKAVNQTQKQLDREVNMAVTKIRRSAADVEKGLESYRKKALAQKSRIEKALKAQAKSGKKAASKAKTSAKKTARKTSKKVTARAGR